MPEKSNKLPTAQCFSTAVPRHACSFPSSLGAVHDSVHEANRECIFLAAVGICRHLSASVGICRHLSASVGICRHLSASVGICRHLSASVGICRHRLSMAPLCFHLLFQADEISLQSLNAGIAVSTLGDRNLPKGSKTVGQCDFLFILGHEFPSH